MSTLSEAELHVQAMRLVCEALADREKTGLEVDWDVINHMHDHMDVIFRGIEDQRRDDQDELMHTRKDRDHWKQARQEAHEAGELMKAEIDTLRERLTEAQQERVDTVDDYEAQIAVAEALIDPEANGETTIAGMAYAILGLREQLNAAQAAVTRERLDAEARGHELERLQAFVNFSRRLLGPSISYADVDRLRAGLAELDAGTEPAPVAEPAPCPECERLRSVIDQAWQRIHQSVSHADVAGLLAALAEIQSNSSATLTSSPTPVAEPLDAEGGK